MTATHGRTLHRFIPGRFALRTLCPGLYTYAKTTRWPSSYAQLLRDRRLVNASLNCFYASLRLGRLRRQAAVHVKTSTFEATVYYTANFAVPLASWPFTWRTTAAHATREADDRTSTTANSGPSFGSVSNASVHNAAGVTLSECPREVNEAPSLTQTTPFGASQCATGSVKTSTVVAAVPHTRKKAPSEDSLQQPAHYLKGWTESAIQFAAVLHKSWRKTSSGLGAAATDDVVWKGDAARPDGYTPGKRVITERLVKDLGKSDGGTQWLFFVHGGAFVLGSPEWYRLVINDLSVLTGAKVFCPNYRLAPESPWPAQLVDCRAAYEHLCQVGGVKGENIIVVGDSAGGNLATALVMSTVKKSLSGSGKVVCNGGEQAQRSQPFPPVPSGLLLMSPWLDLSMKGPSYVLNRLREPVLPLGCIRRAGSLYLHGQFEGRCVPATTSSSFESDFVIPYGCRSATNPWVSPVYAHDSVLLAQMPPTLIHVGSLEVLLSDSLIFARRVNEAAGGVLLPCQPWTATDRQTYENEVQPRSAAKSETGFAFSVSGNRPSKPAHGKTRGQHVEQSMAQILDRMGSRLVAEFSVASSELRVGSRVADLSPEQLPYGDTSYPRDSRGEPGYFQRYGWLGEVDIRTMDSAGVVCASGCAEDARVQVKVWKDEFHAFPCCSFLEAPNGERSLLEMASWAKRRLSEAANVAARGDCVFQSGK